ncbi:MAG: hypothetical protein ACFE95_02190 [Candidatus Hodarchaeota archaeon]
MNHLEERLQCTSEELKIYLTLLAFGSSSKNELSAWTTIPEEDTIQSLQSLEEKGFISKFGGIVEKWTPYYPLGNFIDQLSNFRTNITKSVQEALDILHREQETLNIQNQEILESVNTLSSAQLDLIGVKEKESRNLVEKTSSGISQSISARFTEVQKEIRKHAEENLSLLISNLNNATEDIKTKVEASLTKNTENFLITKESIDSIIIEYQTSAISTLDSFQISLNGLIDTFEQTTSTIGEVFITSGLTSLENVKETTQKSTDLLGANITKSTEISVANITGFHEKLDASLKNLTERLTDISLELIENLMKSFAGQVLGFKNSIQDSTQLSLNKTSEYFNEGETIITETNQKLSENLTGLINELQTGLSTTASTGKTSLESTFDQISQKTDEVFNNSLESLATNGSELKTDLDQKFQENIDELKVKLAENFLKANEAVSEGLLSVNNAITESLNDTSKNMGSEIHLVKDKLIQNVQDWENRISTKNTILEENINSLQANLQSRFKQEFMKGKDQITSTITETIGTTGNKVEESSANFKTESGGQSLQEIEKIQQWIDYFTETVSGITISIEDKFNRAEESLEAKYRGFQESLKQEKGAIIQRIQEEQEILSKIINDLQNQTKESWGSYTQATIEAMNQNKMMIAENLNSTNNELSTLISNLHESVKNSLEETVNSNLEILNDSKNETKRISEEGIEELAKTAENQSLSVQQVINQKVQSFSEILSTQNDIIHESLLNTSDNMIASNTALIDTIKDNLLQSLDDQIFSIKSEAQKLKESTKTSINASKAKIIESFDNLHEQLGSILQDSDSKATEQIIQLNELSTKLKELEQAILTTQNEHLENTKLSLNNFMNTTKELIQSSQAHNFIKLDDFREYSLELIHKSVEQIKKHNTSLQSSIDNYLNGLKSGFDFRLNEVETALNRAKESFNHSIKAAIDQSKQSVDNMIQPSNQVVESASDKTKLAIHEYLNLTEGESKSLLTEFNSNTTDLLNNFRGIIDESFQTVNTNTQSLRNEIEKTATMGITNMQTQSEQAMSQVNIIAQEAIGNMKNKIEDQVKQTFNEVTKIVSNQIPAIFTTGSIDRVAKDSEDLGQLFTELLEQVREHQRPNELTQFIHSKEAIINHINDWLKTAKAGVNIIIPSYVDLDMDVLKEIPIRRRVTIYTNVGSGAWMEPFIDKSNIRFFHLETGEGTQLPPVYAVDRESEEILFAPASAMKAPMAILSSEEPYINAIANNLMSQYMAMARKVDSRNP